MRCVCSGEDSDLEDNYRGKQRKPNAQIYETDDDMDIRRRNIEVSSCFNNHIIFGILRKLQIFRLKLVDGGCFFSFFKTSAVD